ncbi:MAG: cupin domain-containing protein [Candidatus Limnocylindrales bacterium]
MNTILDRAVTSALADADWRPVDPTNPSGPQMAALWGDPTSGPYGALLRVPAGFASPLHRHSRDERVVMISGMSIHWTQDQRPETAPQVSAADFLVMPAGVDHVSAAGPDEDALEFITQDGAFDFVMGPDGTDEATARGEED